MPRHHLAYVFERFPTFTQTFCVREVLELERLGVRPIVFSIHSTAAESLRHYPGDLTERVISLPGEQALVEEVKQLKDRNLLPQSVVLTLRHWGERPDKMRVYEAAWIGQKLRVMDARVSHAHSHFAGMGARACWWLRKFYGLSYSFTAHANDIFCPHAETLPVNDKLVEDASLIVTVSDYTKHDLQQRFPGSAARVRRVYNGLDMEPFMKARAQADRSRAAGGILSVGRLIEKKGFDDLLNACALLRDRGIRFYCRIVGEGPMEENLRSLIATLHLEDCVTLCGALGMPEIIRLLTEETQVFALACKTEHDGGKDNLPTVLMEAMAAALPCVSTRLAGVPEMLVHGVTGLLGEESNPQELAQALETLLGNPELCAQMGRAGQQHAHQHFEKSVTASHLIHAFAAQSSMHFDPALALQQGVVGGLLRRNLTRDSQLGHQVAQARDKSFNLMEFMGGT